MKDKKLYSLRLYKSHDIDLLYLSRYPSISIQKLIAESVRSYIRKKEFKINVPTYDISEDTLTSKQIKVYFNPEKDADVIKELDKVPSHRLSAVIKSITRMYLDKALIDYCMRSDIDIPDEKPERKKYTTQKNNLFSQKKKEKPTVKTPEVITESKFETNDIEINSESNAESDDFFLNMEKMIDG